MLPGKSIVGMACTAAFSLERQQFLGSSASTIRMKAQDIQRQKPLLFICNAGWNFLRL